MSKVRLLKKMGKKILDMVDPPSPGKHTPDFAARKAARKEALEWDSYRAPRENRVIDEEQLLDRMDDIYDRMRDLRFKKGKSPDDIKELKDLEKQYKKLEDKVREEL